MVNCSKRRKHFACYVLALALLLSLWTPPIYSKAASWTPDKLKAGTTRLSAGDTITYKGGRITISYGAIAQETSNNGSLTISDSGGLYMKYIVQQVIYVEGGVEISLTGIPTPDYELQNLMIKKKPAKTTYKEGESFDKKGMVVIACYSNETWKEIDATDYKVSPGGALKTSDTHVTISYTDNRNITKSINVNITVQAKSGDSNNGNSFTITAYAAAGGSISDAGGHSVGRGDSKTYTISPYNGYRINCVEVDGKIVGAVSSYTFSNVHENHSINAYFVSGSDTNQNNATKKKLSVIGSFSAASGAGDYVPGTKVTVDAGTVPGFAFAGWTASDGIPYPMPTFSYVMPAYDVLLYANWVPSGTPNALSPVTTTNLKEPQLSGWTDITNKLATFHAGDLAQPGSPIMKVAISGISCYVDAAPIAMLNTRQGTALELSYGTDASFTFYSDVDNAQFTGTDLSYTCSASTSPLFHEKNLMFTQPGAINTGICLNVSLPDAQSGQIAYVYLVDEKGTETMYLPAIVDAEQKISIPISAKVNLSIKY